MFDFIATVRSMMPLHQRIVPVSPTIPDAMIRLLTANHGLVRELDGRILAWSDGATELYGWSASDARGRISHELLSSEFPAPLADIEAALLQDGHWQGELTQCGRDSGRLRVSANWVLHPRIGQPPLVIEANQDLTRFALAKQSQRYLAAIVQSSDDPIISKSLDGQVTSWNRAAELVLGWSAASMIGQSISQVIPPDLLEEEAQLRACVAAGQPIQHQQTRRLRPDGVVVPVSLTMSPIHDDSGAVIGVSTILRDVTAQRAVEAALQRARDTLEQRVAERTRELASQMEARRQAEAALAQAQKLEAVGQLTGGVAHDFNNLLTIIAGNLHFIEKFAQHEPRLQRLTESTLRAVERGARLTSRLLAFARRQTLQPELLHLDRVVAEFSTLVLRALGESVRLEIRADPDISHCHIDPSQFEAAVLNLTINARDAMQQGGQLEITTRNVVNPAVPDVAPGHYVCVSVADTGHGMPPDVAARAIEPFFTTKEVGKGSGLGLSQVYGFAQQSGGGLLIESEPGAGTRVSMYFPAVCSPEHTHATPTRPLGTVAARMVSVLVVEDDAEVLNLVEDALREDGHFVITAPDGRAGLQLLESHPEVAVLVSDVVMPNGVSGVALGHAARRLRPDIAILLVSGYPRDELNRNGGTDGFAFLSKPFSPTELAAQVQGLLRAQA
jgi:PAS domain S-box-containing protein